MGAVTGVTLVTDFLTTAELGKLEVGHHDASPIGGYVFSRESAVRKRVTSVTAWSGGGGGVFRLRYIVALKCCILDTPCISHARAQAQQTPEVWATGELCATSQLFDTTV